MNKPIYREYSNLRGDHGDPENTTVIQHERESNSNFQDNLIKQSMQYNDERIFELHILSSSTSNCDKKEQGLNCKNENTAPKLFIPNMIDSDKQIELAGTDQGDKDELNRGMLSLDSIVYQKKRIKLRQPSYSLQSRHKRKINWKSSTMKLWKSSLNAVIFILNMKRQIKIKKQNSGRTRCTSSIEISVARKSFKMLISFIKLLFGLILALLISAILLPFIQLSDLFHRIYTYNHLYIRYAMSHSNCCYKILLLLQIYVYVIATVIAIITNLYQTIMTTVELFYNIIGTIQYNMADLTNLLFQTINTPFSK